MLVDEISEWLHSFEPKTWLWNIPADRHFISDSIHIDILIRSISFLRLWSLDLRMDTHDIFHAHNIGSGVFVDYTRSSIHGFDPTTRPNTVNRRSTSHVIMGTPARLFEVVS